MSMGNKSWIKHAVYFLMIQIVCVLFSAMSALAVMISFAGGDGSTDSPYQIATAEQLDAVRDNLDQHFILIANINLDVDPYNAGEGWGPIGTYLGWENIGNSPFTGSLDGNGFSIRGLFINRPTDQGAGLFGLTDGATLKNLHLIEVDITGRTAGGLSGWAFNTTVSSVFSSGTVVALTRSAGLMGEVFDSIISDSGSSCSINTTDGTNAGGLIGQMRGTTVTRSYATGNISAGTQDIAGGLVAEAGLSSVISESYATGDVTGSDEIGGLVGFLSNSLLENSYATGAVNGRARVGGLIGNTSTATILNSYATGPVTATTSVVGGLIGDSDSLSSITSSYYDSTNTGQSDTGTGEPRTTVQLRQQSTFTNWDFTEAWKIVEGGNTPYLAWQPFASIAPALHSPDNESSVTVLRPLFIWSAVPDPAGGVVVGYQIQIATNPEFSEGLQEFMVSITGEPLSGSFGLVALLLLGGSLTHRNFRHKFVLLAMVGHLSTVLMSGCGNSSHSKLVVEQDNNIVAHSLSTDLDSATNYFWRVRTLDDQGQWSSWSPVRSFMTPGGER